jgi:hypothetical protein
MYSALFLLTTVWGSLRTPLQEISPLSGNKRETGENEQSLFRDMKRACNRPGCGFTPEMIVLGALARDPSVSIETIALSLENHGIEMEASEWHRIFDSFTQLTWVPVWMHDSLYAFLSGAERTELERTRLDRYLAQTHKDPLFVRHRIDTWLKFCIEPLLEGSGMVPPCELEPSLALGEENFQYTLSRDQQRQLFAWELERVNWSSGKKRIVKRMRDGDHEPSAAAIPVVPLEMRKRSKPVTVDDQRRFVLEFLIQSPSIELPALQVHMRTILDETFDAEAMYNEYMGKTIMASWAHHVAASLSPQLDDDTVESILILHALTEESVSAEELDIAVSNIANWRKHCILQGDPDACFCNPEDPSEWLMGDATKARLFASLLD